MKTISTFLLIIITTLACSQTDQTLIKQNVNADDFEKMLTNENIQLIDVRTPGEFKDGFIKNAQLIDFTQKAQFDAAIAKLDKEKPVMLYCAVGGRSSKTASLLQEKGFKEIYDLTGGFNQWKASNKPINIPK